LTTYKIPRYVRFTDEFPMTVTGNVQKFMMRDTSTEELGLRNLGGQATA
jgi:fatty-acyl-CoA synthase